MSWKLLLRNETCCCCTCQQLKAVTGCCWVTIEQIVSKTPARNGRRCLNGTAEVYCDGGGNRSVADAESKFETVFTSTSLLSRRRCWRCTIRCFRTLLFALLIVMVVQTNFQKMHNKNAHKKGNDGVLCRTFLWE